MDSKIASNDPQRPSSSPRMPRWDLLLGPVVLGAIRALGDALPLAQLFDV